MKTQEHENPHTLTRCPWCGTDPLYVAYHDTEWGIPCYDDRKLFEFIILETFQAGLSWMTILKKRENFRKAFADFDPLKVACFTDTQQEMLMNDSGIIRNRLKIASAITNARAFLRCQEAYGSFSTYFWHWVDDKP
ncbi:MAG TPA: DNA-3-methyladenine glycosylase I, partial [Spirochaetia bacterium]|nr:DNA-3-methyladenine glycosylase I [Spirochaetia bacterium]